MTSAGQRSAIHSFLVFATAVTCCVIAALAQSEVYTGTAAINTAGGTSVTSPMTVTIHRFASETDRAALIEAVRTGGTTAAQKWMARRPEAGILQLGSRRAAIKFAYKTTATDGALVTVGTAEPILFVGAGVPGAARPRGHELGLLLLQLPAKGAGSGELAPAAKVRIDAQGAIVTEDFNAAEMVRITNVTRK
jgi:hypothetical protein